MTKEKTKKGAASIYAVVFVTLLLGIVTVSFVRLILRESTDTTNSELSSSSRDAALAGVEDAKRAIDHVITNGGLVTDNTYNSCDFVNQELYGQTGEVLIKEESMGDSKTEQAYTCVTVNPNAPNYQGSLKNSNPVAVIPLSRENSSTINKITFEWQTNEDSSELSFPDKSSYQNLSSQRVDGKTVPPVISFQYITTSDPIDPIGNYDAGASTNTSLVYLAPTDSGTTKSITKTNFYKYHNNDHNDTDDKDNSIYVKCDGSDYVCSFSLTDINNNAELQYLIVSLPYGESSTSDRTDFKVTMYDSSNQPINFHGVQYLVDSTGRANDLYTRLEVRLNTVDPNFPYPQFALQTAGNLEKYFWVTNNCKKIDNGNVESCDNSGSL